LGGNYLGNSLCGDDLVAAILGGYYLQRFGGGDSLNDGGVY